MKRLLAILLEMGPGLTVLMAVPVFMFVFAISTKASRDTGREESAAELTTLQSSLDHLRTLNWLLSRQLEREKQSEQLKP